jgi:isocitrate dehydrogenase
VTEPGSVDITFTPKNGGPPVKQHIADLDSGVYLGMFNTNASVEAFGRACFSYALNRGFPLQLSSKNTILKKYDGLFVDTFERLYREEYYDQFQAKNLWYEHRLIDDIVAQVIKGSGGLVWACKNYDGDVQSDIVA